MAKTKNEWREAPLSDKDAAYIAGFIDGEGSFYFVLERRMENRSGLRVAPNMSVSQVRSEVLDWIVQRCGGRLRFVCRENSALDAQDCWSINWSPNQMRWLIPQLRPYLIVKRRVAELMLEFLSLTAAQANYGKYNGKRQWEIYQLVKSENKRGRADYEAQDVPLEMLELRPVANPRPAGACSEQGCENKHYGRGFCQKHYRRKFVNVNPDGNAPCAHCGGAILDRRPDQRYCDSRCRMKAYRKRKK